MAYYITEPLGGSDDVVVSVYKNTGEYVGNIIVDRYKWRMSSDEETRYSIGQFKAVLFAESGQIGVANRVVT